MSKKEKAFFKAIDKVDEEANFINLVRDMRTVKASLKTLMGA